MISANPELEPLEDDEPEPPRLPAVAAPPVPDDPLPSLSDEDELDSTSRPRAAARHRVTGRQARQRSDRPARRRVKLGVVDRGLGGVHGGLSAVHGGLGRGEAARRRRGRRRRGRSRGGLRRRAAAARGRRPRRARHDHGHGHARGRLGYLGARLGRSWFRTCVVGEVPGVVARVVCRVLHGLGGRRVARRRTRIRLNPTIPIRTIRTRPPDPDPPEPQLAVVWSWRQVSWSSAEVSCDCAWLSCRSADVGSRSARS